MSRENEGAAVDLTKPQRDVVSGVEKDIRLILKPGLWESPQGPRAVALFET